MDDPISLSSWPNAILHMDGDAFFASCEQSVHPELKGRPVITGKERNIVASMSYEAKARGVKRATALWEAKQICPDAVILPSDYETYSLISKRMFSILRRFTPMVEESSIDEGFADLKGLRRFHRTGYEGIARSIKETVERELDIPISVGLSITKTLAKLASKHDKPRGFTVVLGRELHHFLKDISVKEVCGIGPNTTALLRKHGIVTVLQYVTKSELWVKALLGKIGTELWHELRGEMVYPLDAQTKTSYGSISKTKTFTPPSNNQEYVKAQLLRNAESALIKLRRYHLRAKRFSIYLRAQDFKEEAVQADLNRPTSSPFEAFPLIEDLFRAIYLPVVHYRATGVVLNLLEEDRGMQFELFEDPVRMIQMKRLSQTIDGINDLFGKHTVYAGTGLFLGRKMRKNKLKPNERNALPQRKKELFVGETFRQRVGLPKWEVHV